MSTKPLSRSAGRSAPAAAAYRSGERLVDERQGLVHDYTARGGVEHTEMVLPEGAGDWAQDRGKLWNAAEFAEKRKDSRTAREWEVALPHELNKEERIALAREFAGELAGRYGVAVDVAIHSPHRDGDERNHHAHLLATTRTVGPDGLGDKALLEASNSKRKEYGLGPAADEISELRVVWGSMTNKALERSGARERVDHRSIDDQRNAAVQNGEHAKAATLDRAPQVKLGWKAANELRQAREENREPVLDRGKQFQAVQGENATRQGLAATLRGWTEAVRGRVSDGIKTLRSNVESLKERWAAVKEKAAGLGHAMGLKDAVAANTPKSTFQDRYEAFKASRGDTSGRPHASENKFIRKDEERER